MALQEQVKAAVGGPAFAVSTGNKSSSQGQSTSAPQSISRNYITRLDSDDKTENPAAVATIATSRPKPHIRINDYFALPTYLSHFSSGNRANRAANLFAKNAGNSSLSENHQKGSNKATPTKTTTLSVQPQGSSGRGPNGNRPGGVIHSLHGEHHKQISSESLAQIPNKGIYKVR